jgi:hypothetical protein
MLGFSTQTAKGKCLLRPNPSKKDKRFIVGGLRALPKVKEAYMGEVGWPTKAT